MNQISLISNLIFPLTKIILYALDYYIQQTTKLNNSKRICLDLRNCFLILESSLTLKHFSTLTEFCNNQEILESIKVKIFEKDKKTKILIPNSVKSIDEIEDSADLNFIIKRVSNFLEKKEVKFYIQRKQETFLSATTKEEGCIFQSVLHQDLTSSIYYIYNPFFTIEIGFSMAKFIINYTYISSVMVVEFYFVKK